MKLKNKDTTIGILICVIIIIGVCFTQYFLNVNSVVNYNIYQNLHMVSIGLNDVNEGLSNYENKQMSLEEFRTCLKENGGIYISMNAYTTKKYKHISRRLEYVNIKALNYYLMELENEKLTDKELEYHKNNIQKICNLWEHIDISMQSNFLRSSQELKEVLKETNSLSEEGYNRILESSE